MQIHTIKLYPAQKQQQQSQKKIPNTKGTTIPINLEHLTQDFSFLKHQDMVYGSKMDIRQTELRARSNFESLHGSGPQSMLASPKDLNSEIVLKEKYKPQIYTIKTSDADAKLSSLNLPGSQKQMAAMSIPAQIGVPTQKPKINVNVQRAKTAGRGKMPVAGRPQSSFTRLSIQNQGAILKATPNFGLGSSQNQLVELQKNITQSSEAHRPHSGKNIDDQMRLYSAKREQRETDYYQLGSSASKKQKSNMDLPIELDIKQKQKSGSPTGKKRDALHSAKPVSGPMTGMIENSRFNQYDRNSSKLTQHKTTPDNIGRIFQQELNDKMIDQITQDINCHEAYNNIIVKRDPSKSRGKKQNDQATVKMNNPLLNQRGGKSRSKMMSQRNASSFDKVKKQLVLSIDSNTNSRDSKKRVVFMKNNNKINESHLNSTTQNIQVNESEDMGGKTPNSQSEVSHTFQRATRAPTTVTLLEKTQVQADPKQRSRVQKFNDKFEIEMITTLPSQKGIVYNDEYQAQFRKAFQPPSVYRAKRDDQWQSWSRKRMNGFVSQDSFQGSQVTQKSRDKNAYNRATKARQFLEKRGNKVDAGSQINLGSGSVTGGPSMTIIHNVSMNQDNAKVYDKQQQELVGKSQGVAAALPICQELSSSKKPRPVSAYVNSKSQPRIRPNQIRSGHPARRSSKNFLLGYQTPHGNGYCSTVGNALNLLEETQSRSMNSTHALRKREQIIKDTQCKLTNISNALSGAKFDDKTTVNDDGTVNGTWTQQQRAWIEKVMTSGEQWAPGPMEIVDNQCNDSEKMPKDDKGLGVNYFLLEDVISPRNSTLGYQDGQNDGQSKRQQIHVLIEKKKRQLAARLSRDMGDGSQTFNTQIKIATTSSATRRQILFLDPPTAVLSDKEEDKSDIQDKTAELNDTNKENRQSQESLVLQTSPSQRGDTTQLNLKPTIFVDQETKNQTGGPQFGKFEHEAARGSMQIVGWQQLQTGQNQSTILNYRPDAGIYSSLERGGKSNIESPNRPISSDLKESHNSGDKKSQGGNTTMSRLCGQTSVNILNADDTFDRKSSLGGPVKHDKLRAQRADSKESSKDRSVKIVEQAEFPSFVVKQEERGLFEQIVKDQEKGVLSQKKLLDSLKKDGQLSYMQSSLTKNQNSTKSLDRKNSDINVIYEQDGAIRRTEGAHEDSVTHLKANHEFQMHISQSLATFEPENYNKDKQSIHDEVQAKKQQLLETDLTHSSLKNLKKHEVDFIAKSHKLQDLLKKDNSSKDVIKRKSSHQKMTKASKIDVFIYKKSGAPKSRGSQSMKKMTGFVEKHKFQDVAKTGIEHVYEQKNNIESMVKKQFDKIFNVFKEIRTVLGIEKTFYNRESEKKREQELSKALDELEKQLTQYLMKNRKIFQPLQQNQCDDIYAKLLQLKNQIRSYKDQAQLMFVRKIEQIQELAARRESLQKEVFDTISDIVLQLQHDFANDKPGLSIEHTPDPFMFSSSSMGLTNILTQNTFSPYPQQVLMEPADLSASRQTTASGVLATTTGATANHQINKQFMPAQAALHSRSTSNKFAKKVKMVLESRCVGLEKAKQGRQNVAKSVAKPPQRRRNKEKLYSKTTNRDNQNDADKATQMVQTSFYLV